MPSTNSAEPNASMQATVGSFIRFGWETFKKRPWYFIAAILILGIASLAFSTLGSIVQTLVDGSADHGLGHLLSWLIANLGGIFVSIGSLAFFIKAHDAPEAVELSDAWRPELFWNYLGTYILLSIILIVGFVLLIIPGIIAAVTFGMAPYLVVDKGLGPIEALKESARITKGNRWRLISLGSASMLISLLGLLCLIVGVFVAAPVTALAMVDAYRRISRAADENTPKRSLTGGEISVIFASVLLSVLFVAGIIAIAFWANANEHALQGTQTETGLQSDATSSSAQ